jgi:hypothetical protein
MANYKKIFFKNPYSPFSWLILGLIVKGLLFLGVILNHPYHDIAGIWGATQADDSSYLDPIDNLIHFGTYTPDFRMPGYGLPYFLFRLMFAQAGACNALIILQLMLASASVYYLAMTVLAIFKNNSIFYLTFYLYLFCSYSNFFDAYICTESLCTSTLIFSVYFFTRYFEKQKNKFLFYAGLLATWAMFIRPVFGGILAACCGILLFQKNKDLKIKVKSIFIFLTAFILCEGYWIYRNFQVHKEFIPFTTTGAFYPNEATSYLEPLFYFAQSWGGVCSFTDKPVDVDWFQYHYPGLKPITHFDSLPDNIYTSAFNKDSLIQLKRMILALQNLSIDTTTASIYQNELMTKLNVYRLSVKKEKPFVYFVQAPFKMIGVMLYGPVTRLYLDRGQSVPIFGKLIIEFNYFIYILILLTGLMGIICSILFGTRERRYLLIIPFIPLYTILVHPFIFRFFDNRFLMPAFPFLIICSACFFYKIYTHYTAKPQKVA